MTTLRNDPTTAEPRRSRMTGIRMAHTRGKKKFWRGWSESTKGFSQEESTETNHAVSLPTNSSPSHHHNYSKMASTETMSPAHKLGRDRSPPSRPRSPRRDRDPPRRDGGDSYRPARGRPAKKERSPPPPPPARTEEEKQAAAKAEYEKLLTMRSGGTYIPPARLRALQAQITDKTSKEYQRMAWDALKKSINGLINKINVANIKAIVPELFAENLIRGRGLFCQSITKAQAASLPFTPIYAAMAAIVNTKLPQVGELLVKRLVLRFRKAFRRNDKAVCLATTTFIAHLVNQQVVHETVAAEMLILLLERPTDDSVEIAVGLTREVGQHLEEMNPDIARIVFDRFRGILHEADIDRRVQYMIEVLFQVRKDKFKDNPAIKEELDLVEEEDQITHQISLNGEVEGQDTLNIFKFDEQWEENEEAYKKLKNEILGEGSDYEDDEDEDDDESSSEEEEGEQKALEIKDQSNADLINLRRTIYLTLQSSADPEEATHKLVKLRLPPGQETELVSMVVESCAEAKTYVKFYGLIAERISRLNRMWMDLFEESFVKYYDMIHRYETNKLRNIACLFGHLLASDAIGWHVLSVIHLNEEETTSASRIFIKILFQDVAENIGMAKLRARMADEALQPSFQGIFPHDNPRNIRFSINYFTSIGMGVLTQEMRDFLQNMPKPALPAPVVAHHSDSESVSSYSSYTSSSYYSRSPSRSRSPPRRVAGRARSYSPTPPPRGNRNRSYSRGRSPSRSISPDRPASRSPRRDRRRDSRSVTPPPARARPQRRPSYSRSPTYSRSPPPRARRGRSPSGSRSRSPPPPAARRRNTSSVSSIRPRATRRDSYSASPPPRRRGRNTSPSVSASPEPRPSRRNRSYSSRSASASPPPPARVPLPRDSMPSRSPPAPGRGGRRNGGRRESLSRSPTPPSGRGGRRGGRGGGGRGGPPPRRRASISPSRSPSPAAAGKRRRLSSSRSPSPPPTKRGRVAG
ncbi:hypothetical protein QBC33DRAFT_489990 [Phialemonium atrogriseum]|uniref:Pre-mRNA-splicing factor CWC22 n=1 Tax=Phialemonium atrogriseum TaxID=1093897 RepID=A0AAJ0C4L9_9PEZI|nr:uncharacterized protein QBC33DRAFT_489990 [Phialemonium atrogriseum]KAK1768619.1 hypothetical protein QBC33DRAFT_489990 [Phialemonium atrogriseum]